MPETIHGCGAAAWGGWGISGSTFEVQFFAQACKEKLGLKQNNMKRKKIKNDEKKKTGSIQLGVPRMPFATLPGDFFFLPAPRGPQYLGVSPVVGNTPREAPQDFQ